MNLNMHRSPPRLLAIAFAAVAIALPAAFAGDVIVKVSGARNATGAIGCALFASAKGFPLDNSNAIQQWLPVDGAGATCRFSKVVPGIYAVSVSHDLNGNKKTDTNFVGIPTEGWAVSNNVSPTLRAPRFDEAAFRVDGAAEIELHLALKN